MKLYSLSLADRMAWLDTSGVRKLFETASKMKNPVDLSVGFPDFDVPDTVKEAAIDAIRSGKNRYTMAAGVSGLRKAIQGELCQEGVNAEAVMAVSGASGGLIISLLAIADSSTEVFLPDPCFITYPHMIRLAGAHIRWVDTYPDFRLTPERLCAAAQNSRASKRVLLFNSPVNPTGVAYRAEEIAVLARTAKKLGLQVISDEVYNLFCYEAPHECWLKHDPQAILIRAFSKSWAMTGWRCGYAAGPAAAIEAMTDIQQFVYVCVNSPAQWGAVVALQTDMSREVARYRNRRDILYDGLKGTWRLARPEGAFYAFVEIPHGDAEKFFQKCKERELLLVPGNLFSRRNTHFRVSFSVSETTLRQGIDLLREISGF